MIKQNRNIMPFMNVFAHANVIRRKRRGNEQPRPKGRGIRRVRVVYHHVVLCMLYAASGEELNPKLIKPETD